MSPTGPCVEFHAPWLIVVFWKVLGTHGGGGLAGKLVTGSMPLKVISNLWFLPSSPLPV